jgi:hypothetical protein
MAGVPALNESMRGLFKVCLWALPTGFVIALTAAAAWPLIAGLALFLKTPQLVQSLSSPESMDIKSLPSLELGSTFSNPSINL